MIRARPLAVMVLVACAAGSAAARAMEQDLDILAELQLDALDATQSWTGRGQGKLRGGTANDATDTVAALRVAFDYRAQFTETLGAQLVADAYAGANGNAGFTEGWLTLSPVPESAWQHRVRAGGFIPPFSLEHVETGWTSPWMPTASVLNSWIGEELHVTGAEFTLRHAGALAHSANTITLRAAVFQGNDTAGTLLSWRGWVTNDRVTPREDLLPLPDRAVFRPGGTFPGLHDTDPFVELDDRPGYYLAGEWRHGSRLKLLAGHYDNRADPLAFADGQAGWRTRFQVVGMQYKPTPDSDVLFQYAAGNTFVGSRGTVFSADNDFSAGYLLANRHLGRHRLSARVEVFKVTDDDPNTLDDNREDGTAWALAWQYDLRDDLRAGLEFLHVQSDRPERERIGLPIDASERQVRLMLRAAF